MLEELFKKYSNGSDTMDNYRLSRYITEITKRIFCKNANKVLFFVKEARRSNTSVIHTKDFVQYFLEINRFASVVPDGT